MNRDMIGSVGKMMIVTILTLAAAGACFAQEKRGGGRLLGTWDAVVSLTNCQTGDTIRTFPSIASFNEGGTTIGSTAGLPQSSRTPEHGVWRHLKGNTYEFKFKSFSFDAAGNPTGWSVVTHEIELSQDGDEYTSAGIAQIFLMNGVQVAQGCSSAVGTRFSF